MSEKNDKRTLRLIMPQWQGGNNPAYHFGAQLLAWLAPVTQQETVEVPIMVTESLDQVKEDGIIAKQQLLAQTKHASEIIHERQPDRLVVLGGDCSVELAPFAYLAEKYENDFAILWIDAHPDITTPDVFPHYHAMVLATLLGEGDLDFAALVPSKVNPNRIVFAGINDESEKDRSVYQKFGFPNVPAAEFGTSSHSVLSLLKKMGVSRVAIHFDLDVLDIHQLRSTYFAQPGEYEKHMDTMPKGASIESVTRLIQEVSSEFDVVGLGITEHLPWDSIALSSMLNKLPLLND
ncbi:arginase family protein [Paenibacillus sp. SZ31]|uniref:arginase family protein n=1 Tax=unclassified Paenibacillus TaxID=185978 RepID=UPI00146DBC9A|nr:arginase family protein [Paenibacillus sp. SZ31]NMI03395.1 arginase family protein [Paenibacillus sp. SZ31]